MAVASKRLRFEILKRDNFRCRYCGASSVSTLLHVDHVVPESKGGTDDPENLVTACADCNLGKSDKSLDDLLPPAPAAEAVQEHTEQVDAYLTAQRELEAARWKVVDELQRQWFRLEGEEPDKYELIPACRTYLRSASAAFKFEDIVSAMAMAQSVKARDPWVYFCGIIRNWRNDGVRP